MTSKNLFYNASVRLTVIYLLIIVFISLLFSIGLYRVSSQELEQSLKRPITPIEKRLLGGRQSDLADIINERTKNLAEAENRLQNQLIVINISIFVIGGGLSYILARRTLKPIEEAHEAQSRFTADASHELRTPLTAMRLEAEIALTDPKLTLKDAKKLLHSSIEELDKISNLTERLLHLARTEGNHLHLDDINLDSLITKSLQSLQHQADAKKIKLLISLEASQVKGDEPLLLEALVVVIDNAIKYTPNKGTISITAKNNGRHATIDIADTGPGIAPKHLPHIFDRFYRVDASRSKNAVAGYGIGLAIAKTTIEAHGGSISVQNNTTTGATFSIQLPLSMA